jgi:toxin ParE1/3/4
MPVIRRTAQAEEDLIALWLYIAQDSPGAADRLLEEIEAKCILLADYPQLGLARPDIAEDCRYLPVGRYLILYRIISDGIEVVRVVEGSRRLEGLLP